ncbi:phage tail assembly protein [Azospirillum sp. SYSU D00513]|uniref:phage tail assembly protein n=1 Tax=Azospirillum sp. SYSU D00513 TaxID=2812561 RepID=UPI001A964080|nr:phage tail assembly protein [Azospirillum sp. SYSU D00513]
MTTVNLKKPIQAHGEQAKSLTFREPNGDDIMTCGYPLQMQGDGSYTPIAGTIGKYIARLAGIPASSVKTLGPADFNACMMAIIPFFGDGDTSPVPESEG